MGLAAENRLTLSLAVYQRPDPILESPANRFLITQLGSHVPVRYSFSTFTIHGLCNWSFALDRIVDHSAIGYRSPAFGAYNLVFHLIAFHSKESLKSLIS
jgi:hypothetical protein